MSKTVDFIETNLTNLTTILRPSAPSASKPTEKRPTSVKIVRSFEPERQSSINAALRPEIEKLKQQLKKQMEQEKRRNAEYAEGKITKEEKEQKDGKAKE
jgi:hypothetical protein